MRGGYRATSFERCTPRIKIKADIYSDQPGPGCSKLTTSLVNVSVKFQTVISEIRHYLLLKKYEKLLQLQKLLPFFFNKNISVFGYKVVKYLTS